MGKRRTVITETKARNDLGPDAPLDAKAIDRRKFVKVAGGIIVGVGLGCEDGTTPTGAKGKLRVNITGLATGAQSGGSVVITPAAGGAQISFNIPAAATQEREDVPVGTWNVAYTKPSGYNIVSTVPPQVTITEGQLTIVDIALSQVAQTGTIQVTVTGIVSGAADGGSASVTPAGGGTAVPIPISAAGAGSAVFNAGSYSLTYTPPSGHSITTGSTPQTVTVTAGQTTTVTFTVSQIVGTLQVTVTGIASGTANGGSAAVTPSGGGSPVTVNVSAAGSGSQQFVPGSYSVMYTPPAGHTISTGANPQTVTITGNATATATWTVTQTQVFPTPNLKNNVSFETNFDGFTNWGLSGAPTGVTRETTRAFDGATSIRKALVVTSGSDVGSQCVYQFPTDLDRVWGRFYFYLDGNMNGILKLNLFFDGAFNQQFGGLYFGQGSLAVFLTPEMNQFIPLVNLSSLVGAWHSLEMDFWRNGDTSKGGQDFPSMGIWLDGNQITSAQSTPLAPASFINGRLNYGVRNTSIKLGIYELLGVLNGNPANTVACNVHIDKVAISSVGRIGP